MNLSKVFIVLFLIPISLSANVKSTTGKIQFDVQMDDSTEMTLNSTGLGIGTTPSSNLHVHGNALVSQQAFVGGDGGTSSLNVNGTLGFEVQTISTNTLLSGNSLILANTSSDNIVIRLPQANDHEGRQYFIKKTSDENHCFIRDGGFIDSYSDVTLSVNNRGRLSIVSSSGNWHILDISGNGDMISTDNLVGWWKLDETTGSTASDSSQFQNDGTHTNLDSNDIGVEAKFNKGIDFDGVDDYLVVADHPSIGDDIVNRFSLSIWFNSNVALSTSMGTYRLLEKGSAYFLLQGNGTSTGNGGMNFLIKSSSVNYIAEINQALNANQWYHLTATFDGADIKIYLDGVLKDTTNVGGPIDDSNLDLRIGSDDSGSFFNGKVDDVRIYNRTLSLSEIEGLYQQGR